MNILIALFVAAIFVPWISGESLVGGLSEVEQTPVEKDDAVLAIVPELSTEIRSQVSAKLVSGDGNPQTAIKDAQITVLGYKTQVVAGRNYFVKTRIGNYIFHLRIYDPIHGNPTLDAVRGPLKESDPIEYFA